MSETSALNILWFKRDLRLRDHLPLEKALERGQKLLLIYIFEPELQAYPDWNIRHWRFIWQSLEQLQSQLQAYRSQVHIFYGNARCVFESILEKYEI
ncbi:MAG: deoxyribodipyrimidine photo-lyase [Bacteroidota bacterium]